MVRQIAIIGTSCVFAFPYGEPFSVLYIWLRLFRGSRRLFHYLVLELLLSIPAALD